MKITSLVKFLQELGKLDSNIYINENEIYYRGEAADYKENKLLPKVFRKDLKSGERLFCEQDEYNRALRQRPEEFDNNMTRLDILSKMQHFGIATRLLDYTTNPLVALYFACQEDNSDDGYVYLMYDRFNDDNDIDDYFTTQYDDPRVIMISNLVTLSDDELNLYARGINFQNEEPDNTIILQPKPNYFKTLYDEIHYDGNPDNIFSISDAREYYSFQNIQLRLSSNSSKEYPLFTRLEISPSEILYSYFVKPLFTNQNIQRQQGLFYLRGLNESIIKPKHTFVIPKKYKIRILLELKLFAGIDNSSLFSGLDGVANNKNKMFKEYINSKIKK